MAQDLLDAISEALSASSLTSGEGTSYLDLALHSLGVAMERQSITPSTLDVVDEYFEAAIALTNDVNAQRVGRAFYALRGELHWERAYGNYSNDPFMDHFRANFAMTALMWPGHSEHSLFRSETVGIAVTIQAPHTDYPTHVHKAVEFYYPLGGTAKWLRGEEDWTTRAPGNLIFHDTGVRHATRTAEEPLLSLIVWVNDFDSESVIVRA
jgi:quercetin dioxygenase-like cupin family protein